jgi:hypothetical protein
LNDLRAITRDSFTSLNAIDPFFKVQVRARGLTVRHVVDAINTWGLGRYTYDGESSGCLHWCKTLLRLLIRSSWIRSEAAGDFEVYLAPIRANARFSVPHDRGRFLDENGYFVPIPQLEPAP